MPAASAVGSLAVGWAQIQTKTNQNKTARDEFDSPPFFYARASSESSLLFSWKSDRKWS
jgi:hypothetical protein